MSASPSASHDVLNRPNPVAPNVSRARNAMIAAIACSGKTNATRRSPTCDVRSDGASRARGRRAGASRCRRRRSRSAVSSRRVERRRGLRPSVRVLPAHAGGKLAAPALEDAAALGELDVFRLAVLDGRVLHGSAAAASSGGACSIIVSASGSVSSDGSIAGAPHGGAGASTYGAGSRVSSSGGRNATAGGTKRERAANHSEIATTANASDISRTITQPRNCATPAITATATRSAVSAASRRTTPGISGVARS